MTWHPERAPDPAHWLAMDEQRRAEAVVAWHEAHPQPALHAHDLNLRVHGSLHAVVESQVAADDPPVARETLERLMGDGLRRHPAMHAIMAVLIEHMRRTMVSGRPFDTEAYAADLRAIRPEDAIDVHGLARMEGAPREAPTHRTARRRKRKSE